MHCSLPVAQSHSQRLDDNCVGPLPLVDYPDGLQLDVGCLWVTPLQKNRGFPLFQHSVLFKCLAMSFPRYFVLKSYESP